MFSLSKIRYSDDQAARLNDLAEEGIVAYVHRSKSGLTHWLLKQTIGRLHLPAIVFSAFKNSSKAAYLIRAVRMRLGALEFFLRKPNTAFSVKKSFKRDYIRTLIKLQKTIDIPIFLVPHLLIVGARTSNLRPSAMDMIF